MDFIVYIIHQCGRIEKSVEVSLRRKQEILHNHKTSPPSYLLIM